MTRDNASISAASAAEPSAPGGGTLADVYDPRLNGLNLLRLLLASGVIFWHAFPLTGAEVSWPPLRQLLGQFWVDGFFVISGFLIVGSWIARPHVGRFLSARALRLLPGFWVCLVVTAAVLAPLGILLSGTAFPADYLQGALRFVGENFFLRMNEYGIAGTPDYLPYPGVWNGSLWTLFWEFCCYLGVMLIGVLGLFRFRVTIPLLFVATLAAAIVYEAGVSNYYLHMLSRFGLMFAAGALVYRFQRSIPVRGWLLALAGTLVALSSLLPHYRLVAALPIAYLLIGAGALIKRRALRFDNDISYGIYAYAFPVQQILAGTAAVGLAAPLFAAASLLLTLPLAAASWFWIERPAKDILRAHRARRNPPVVQVAGGQGAEPGPS